MFFGKSKPSNFTRTLVGEWRADLLVTGSHGHRLLGDLFLGSTASGIRHRVACPVLTVRSRRPAENAARP